MFKVNSLFYNVSSGKDEQLFSATAWRPMVDADGKNLTAIYYDSIEIKQEKIKMLTDSVAKNATTSNDNGNTPNASTNQTSNRRLLLTEQTVTYLQLHKKDTEAIKK